MPRENPTALNLRLLKAFGIDLAENGADRVVLVTLELRPQQFPSLMVKRIRLVDGAAVERIEALQLRAVAAEEGMPAVSAPAVPASMSTDQVR